MNIDLYKQRVRENVVAAMFDYMSEDEDCGYSKKDVQKCESLLLNYLEAICKLENPTDALIMAQVKKLVLALNKLNEKTDYCLIETDVREEIWQIIQDSAVECGLTDPSEDKRKNGASGKLIKYILFKTKRPCGVFYEK